MPFIDRNPTIMRSTRQRSKPVNVILRKTEFGYEVLEEKPSEPLPRTKTTIAKGDKAGSPDKSSVPKSAEREGDSTSVPPTPVTTAPKKPKGAPKSNLKASKQPMLKSPSVHTESEAQRRDDMGSPSENQDAIKNDASSTTAQERPEKPETTSKFERAERAERPEKMVKIVEPKFTEPKLLDLNSYEHLKVTKKYPVLVPTISNWFDMSKIHQNEREALPEFFSGKPSKTPEVYKKYRNFIITLFRSNPRHYLHATTCRRSLAGDVNGIIRVHNFLEQWGLINFNVDPTTYPQNLFMTKPNFGLESKFKPLERKVTSELAQQEKLNQAKNSESDLLLSQIRILNKQSRPLCHQCGLICGIVWYNQKNSSQYQNQPKMFNEGMATEENTLCLRCFTEGNLPAQTAQSDFLRVDLLNKYNPNFPKNPSPSYWTQEETIRLLDLFELDKDPWEEVPRYFPYKTKDDIILHWLQLPVKNISLLESLGLDEEDDTHDRATAESLTELAQGMLDEFSNPLISQMGIFKEVLDKFSGGKGGKEGVTEEKFEEGYEQKGGKGEGRMEVEVEKQQENEGVTIEGQGGESQPQVDAAITASKRYDIEVVQLDKKDVERKKVDEKLERLYTIIDKEGQIIDEVEKETRHRAATLRKKEEDKIRETANILIDLQINKLEAKLSFLEEYEKVLGQEKKQNEMFQKMLLADKIHLVHKRLDSAKPPPAAQTQTQTQNQQQFFDGSRDSQQQQQQQHQQQQQQQQPQQPAYFGFMGNANIDDMFSLGTERLDEFPADGF